jgi:NOL1/NOP2/sun family putative RNA methylase
MSSGLIPPLPAPFLERMANHLEAEYPAFAAELEKEPVNGLRVNTLKCSPEEFQAISPAAIGDKVPWCPSAFILPASEFSFGRHPYHLAGLYYLQDPSAMAPAELLQPQPGERILDLAASPGGKTTHLAALMHGTGLLVANEIKDKRLGHLAFNVERWGAGNVVVTNETPERLADQLGSFFDRVLVDAPCSGEGMFRKDMGARLDWSPEMVAGCAIRQQNILKVAAKLVRPGGYLLYSTCTFAPEEDEGAIDDLLINRPGFQVMPLPQLTGFMPGRPDWLHDRHTSQGLEGAVRLFPHRVRGEGHFACLLKRAGNPDTEQSKRKPKATRTPARLASLSTAQEYLWKDFSNEGLDLDLTAERLRLRGERLYLLPEVFPDFGDLRVVHPGVWLGTFKKDRFEPAHPLALFLRRDQVKVGLDLSSSESSSVLTLQRYLRGEMIASSGPAGWILVTVDGWPLGWGKRVLEVVKNHYPRGWQMVS